MRTRIILSVLVLTALLLPAAASARTCISVYEQCLNDTWNTSGITRILADIECGARYAGCVRAAIL
jgi:hypothetical protein